MVFTFWPGVCSAICGFNSIGIVRLELCYLNDAFLQLSCEPRFEKLTEPILTKFLTTTLQDELHRYLGNNSRTSCAQATHAALG